MIESPITVTPWPGGTAGVVVPVTPCAPAPIGTAPPVALAVVVTGAPGPAPGAVPEPRRRSHPVDGGSAVAPCEAAAPEPVPPDPAGGSATWEGGMKLLAVPTEVDAAE